MTKKEALSIVFSCAPLYKENLVDKSLLFITTDKHKSVHAGLAAVHIAALAQFGASCRVHRGAEGVHPVKPLPLQGADVIAEQGEHQCFLGL
jgi:hypothetical protein